MNASSIFGAVLPRKTVEPFCNQPFIVPGRPLGPENIVLGPALRILVQHARRYDQKFPAAVEIRQRGATVGAEAFVKGFFADQPESLNRFFAGYPGDVSRLGKYVRGVGRTSCFATLGTVAQMKHLERPAHLKPDPTAKAAPFDPLTH